MLHVTDPPFDERTHAGARTNKRRIDPFTNEIDFAHMDPTVFVPEMLRITKRWIVCFCALEQLAVYQSVAGDAYVRGGVWVKNNAMPQITGDRPAQGVEGVAIMHRPGAEVLFGRNEGGGQHFHGFLDKLLKTEDTELPALFEAMA